MQTKSLKGKVALVTSGSKGIGAGIVRRLAADGASVAFTYSVPRKGRPTCTDMNSPHAELVKTLIPLKRMGDVSPV